MGTTHAVGAVGLRGWIKLGYGPGPLPARVRFQFMTANMFAPLPTITTLLGRPGRGSGAALGFIALLAVFVPLTIVSMVRVPPARPPLVPSTMPVVPKTKMPSVDAVTLASVDPDDARRFNATIPFSTAPNPAARPFRLADQPGDAARAVDCLASAVLYEAGDDREGQRAVAQVVINRVRHPAFPKTICGVVYQGAERRTGCQFTFTCDGALINHRWSDAEWMRARTVATAALAGQVFAKVGYATHYHTDWVVPYWSSSLDKVSAVGTHLFFRWTGWWGTPPAFNRRVATMEPIVAQLARFSLAHGAGPLTFGADGTPLSPGEPPAEPYIAPTPVPGDPNVFLATIDRRAAPDSFRSLAEASCGTRPYCKYMAWTTRIGTPTALPMALSKIATMSFSYLRDRTQGFEKALWRCSQFPRADRSQCMKVDVIMPTAEVSGVAEFIGDGPVTGSTGTQTPPSKVEFPTLPRIRAAQPTAAPITAVPLPNAARPPASKPRPPASTP